MKKLFILAVAISSSLLFVQCKKTETLIPQEEVVTTVKSLSDDQLQGTAWQVLSVESLPNAVSLSWNIKYPKFTFNNGIVEMKLGRDLCTKNYVNSKNKLTVTSISTCAISNPAHVDLYNLFEGDFEITFSTDDPSILFVKNTNGTAITLRKISNSSTTSNNGSLNID